MSLFDDKFIRDTAEAYITGKLVAAGFIGLFLLYLLFTGQC